MSHVRALLVRRNGITRAELPQKPLRRVKPDVMQAVVPERTYSEHEAMQRLRREHREQ